MRPFALTRAQQRAVRRLCRDTARRLAARFARFLRDVAAGRAA